MNDLSKNVVEIATEYLGPAGEIFIKRQIERLKNNVTLDNLSAEHLDELASFCKQAGSLYVDKATEFSDKIKELK